LNRKNVVAFAAGVALGFITSLAVTLLFLSKPIRSLGAAAALGFASLVIARKGDKPRDTGHLRGAGFFLGYGIGVAVTAILDLLFPPIT
jgi:hypothetical protein